MAAASGGTTLDRMRVLILVHWREEGKWDLLKSLEARGISVTLLQPAFPFPPHSPFNRFCAWLAEFYLPLLAMGRRRQFDIVVSWSMRTGVCFGLLNRLYRSAWKGQHIIQDFHINMARKGLAYQQRLKLLRGAIKGIDCFLCTSTQEADIYSEFFKIQREHIRFFPLAPPRHFLGIKPLPRDDYLFSYGNSDRDYETLIRAVRELRVPTVILSQAYRPSQPLPPNVSLITARLPLSSMIRWNLQARCVVLPITDRRVAAGQLAMLETMALGSPLIISQNWATREYAVPGRDALFFEPGDVDALRTAITALWESPRLALEMGAKARHAAGLRPDMQVAAFVALLNDSRRLPEPLGAESWPVCSTGR